jgi:hypothetical protein
VATSVGVRRYRKMIIKPPIIPGVPNKCIHILRDVIYYVLLTEVELNYGSNV